MSMIIHVVFSQATKTLPPRYIAKCKDCYFECEPNNNLTVAANMRYAANQLIRELNLDYNNTLRHIRYEILGGGEMPDGKSHVYVAESV